MIYEYKCSECGKSIDQNRPVSERDEERKHDTCEGTLVRAYTFRGAVWAPTAGGLR